MNRKYLLFLLKKKKEKQPPKKKKKASIIEAALLGISRALRGLKASLYILRGFRKLVIAFLIVKNTPKLINHQLKNEVKIVNWQKKVSYYFYYSQKYPYLKLKNGIKIVNWQK